MFGRQFIWLAIEEAIREQSNSGDGGYCFGFGVMLYTIGIQFLLEIILSAYHRTDGVRSRRILLLRATFLNDSNI